MGKERFERWTASEFDNGPNGRHWEVTVKGEESEMPMPFPSLDEVINAARNAGAIVEVQTIDWYYRAVDTGYFDIDETRF